MTLEIRPAELADGELLSSLGRETFIKTFGSLYSEADLQSYLDSTFTPDIQSKELSEPQSHHRIAMINGEAVGYSKSGLNKLPISPAPLQPSYELHRIYLLPKGKGQGLGKALLMDAMAYFERQNAASVYLGVYSENIRAQTFYASFGFTKVGEYEFMVGEKADHEFIMKWSNAA